MGRDLHRLLTGRLWILHTILIIVHGGGDICGKNVYKPQQLEQEDWNQIFVFIAADKTAWEMAQQLAEMGLLAGTQFLEVGPLISKYRPDWTVPSQELKEHPYEDVHIGYRYAPWRVDEDFLVTYSFVKGITGIDHHRLWKIWSLEAEAAKVDGIAMEVGVFRGGSGSLIARRWRLLGRTEPIFLCDTFEGVVKAGAKDNQFKGGEYSDTSKERVENFVQSLGLTNIHILKGIFPDDTGAQLPDVPIAFAHIDVDVYESGKEIVRFIWSRLSHGGILVFDDYGFESTEGIRQMLDELKQRDDLIFIYASSGQGIVIKK